MGFLHPLALLALPLALLPLWLEWRGLRTGRPVRFSSVYLLERARRARVPLLPTRSRWVALLRALAVALLVVAAARPLGCGSGDPASHRPTRAIVAVDVSASAGQLADGVTAWSRIRAAADSLLAAASPEDRVALAAVADGIAGWWEAPVPALRARLAALTPGDRPSDWPRVLAALDSRIEEGTEAYLFTDGSAGAVPPAAVTEDRTGYRLAILRGTPASGNRGLVSADWIAAGEVSLAGAAWGDAPVAAEVGRGIGARDGDVRTLALDGTAGGTTWDLADSATFGFRQPDAFPADDRLYVARGAATNRYDIVRWVPGDEPPESGTLFWEAALDALPGPAEVGRAGSLSELAARSPELALLPIRSYSPGEAALLEQLAAAGTRLLFSPACTTAACAPDPGWLPAGAIAAPDLRLEERDAASSLAGRPASSRAVPVPEPLLDRAPVRGGLVPGATPAADWTWGLASGAPAFWVRGMVGVWLVPLGPPYTNLATTPVFPLVAGAAIAAWDPRWASGGSGSRVGERISGLPAGATVTGPVGAEGGGAGSREVSAEEAGPVLDRAGIYVVRDPAGGTIFLAVNGDPAEGNLARVPNAAWEAAWGPVAPDDWRSAVFPRRRGPELWPWALVLALLALAAEAAVRRARLDD